MSDTKAARRYSEALFRLAAEQGCLDAVASDLRAIQRLSQESPALADLKASPRISAAEKIAALEALFGASAHPLTLRFLRFLVERRRMAVLDAISQDFEGRHLEHNRIKVVTVVSAQALTPAQAGALTAKLAARLGCDVRLHEQTDPALLAGLRLRIGDRVEDYTAAAQIRRFHKAVLNA